jgi:hypothetical protein
MVDAIYTVLAEAYMTPHEVRQATAMACIKYEMERPDLFKFVREGKSQRYNKLL